MATTSFDPTNAIVGSFHDFKSANLGFPRIFGYICKRSPANNWLRLLLAAPRISKIMFLSSFDLLEEVRSSVVPFFLFSPFFFFSFPFFHFFFSSSFLYFFFLITFLLKDLLVLTIAVTVSRVEASSF